MFLSLICLPLLNVHTSSFYLFYKYAHFILRILSENMGKVTVSLIAWVEGYVSMYLHGAQYYSESV